MIVHRVHRQAQHLDAALVEFRFQLGDRAQLGGADRREILGMGEEQHPAIAGPVIEVQLAFGGVGGEVGGGFVDGQGHGFLLNMGRSSLARSVRACQPYQSCVTGT